MTTITINNPRIEKKYNKDEIAHLFVYFLENKLKEDSVDLYQVSVSDLPEDVLDSYDNIDNMNFIER
jgi:hypothetical protein